jgi:hypothetical protein
MTQRIFKDRFWGKVDKTTNPDGCWMWKAYCDKRWGYGYVGVGNGKIQLSHRVAWELTNGTIPEGFEVCHSCDNPPCCNPSHLFLGTQKENNDDCINKGRQRHPNGELHGRAKLTAKQVREIRERYVPNIVGYRELARIYKVSKTEVFLIVKAIHWKNI